MSSVWTVYNTVTGSIRCIIRASERIAKLNCREQEAMLSGYYLPSRNYINVAENTARQRADMPLVVAGNVVSGIPPGVICSGQVINDGVLQVTSDVSGDTVITLTHPHYLDKQVTVTIP